MMPLRVRVLFNISDPTHLSTEGVLNRPDRHPIEPASARSLHHVIHSAKTVRFDPRILEIQIVPAEKRSRLR
jgi:hypothetical protein